MELSKLHRRCVLPDLQMGQLLRYDNELLSRTRLDVGPQCQGRDVKYPNESSSGDATMQIVGKIISLVGLIVLGTSCASNFAHQETEKADLGKPTLYGEWTAQTIDSDHFDWTNLVSCKLLVYEHPDEQQYTSDQGQVVSAELLVRQRGMNADELAYDSQPVLMKSKELLVGSIGGFYRFRYELTNDHLRLEYKTKDGYLNLVFRRTSTEPGLPRFPQITRRPPANEE